MTGTGPTRYKGDNDMKRIAKAASMILAAVLVILCLAGCAGSGDEYKNAPLPIVTIVVKDYGTMTAELYPAIAPETVKNFISLANSGFYNGLTFHRVISGFMIQGGDPKGNGGGGPGYCIKGEYEANGFKNELKHTKGVLSMARKSNPYVKPDPYMDSAGSQFFIMQATATHLDGSYAAFGKVIDGLEIIDTIAGLPTDSNDKPRVTVTIESITVDTKGVTYGEPKKLPEI